MRLARALARPWVMVVLAAALSFEVSTLPVDPVRDAGESTIGRLVARALTGREPVVYFGAREVASFIAKDPGLPTGFAVLDPDQQSMDAIVRRMREEPQTIATVGVLARPVARGLWRPTRTDHEWTMKAPVAWSAEDRARAISTLATHLRKQDDPELVALGQAIADGSLKRVRLVGYAHNALDAGLLLAFLMSTLWIFPGSNWRVHRALRRSRCPNCGYSLADLEPEATGSRAICCPECGKSCEPSGEQGW